MVYFKIQINDKTNKEKEIKNRELENQQTSKREKIYLNSRGK